MGKIRDLEIRYDRPSAFAGGVLTGNLCFYLKDVCKLKDLSMCVDGQTKVTLPGESSNERCLLRTELNLAPYLAQYNFRLPHGAHQVPFAFHLPPSLPSSFGDKHGYIYYSCRAVLGNEVYKVRKPFTLIGIEDLNWHPYAALPITLRDYGCKSFWAFGRQGGSVQVLLTLDRAGYVPGECIEVTAEIVNNSKKKLKSSIVQLQQGVLYKTAGGRTKETFQIVADLQHGPLQPGGIDQWEKEQMIIPPLPPSFLRGSENITLKYELIFAVPDASVTLVMPIIIGTVPYHPDNARRMMKALPWHETKEPIYGTRQPMQAATQPPQPAPVPMQQGAVYQPVQHAHINKPYYGMDENDGPLTGSEDENQPEYRNKYTNGFNGHNGFKQPQFDKQSIYGTRVNNAHAGKLLSQNKQEEVYGNRNGCYYYNEQPRFLRIEEID